MTDRHQEADPSALERRLRGFYDAYYSELRQRMSRYPAASGIFPYYLRGARRIVATLAKDGFLAVHYPAERDSFEFEVAAERRVTDLTEVLEIVLPNGYRHEFFPKDPEDPEQDFDMAATLIAPRGVYNDQEIKPDYVRADVAAARVIDEVYTEEKARKQGESDAMLAADAYLMGLERVAPEEKKDRVVAALENAIDQFEQVVDREPQEWMIQEFLTIKGNQILLDPSALSVTPKVRLGSEYEIDFVVQEAEDQYVLVEIEQSGLPVLTGEGRPRAHLTHAQQQVKDWFDWIGRHGEYARSIMPGIGEPKGRVIMGRRNSIPPEHRHVLARESAESRRITTQTYDELLDRARQHLANLRSM